MPYLKGIWKFNEILTHGTWGVDAYYDIPINFSVDESGELDFIGFSHAVRNTASIDSEWQFYYVNVIDTAPGMGATLMYTTSWDFNGSHWRPLTSTGIDYRNIYFGNERQYVPQPFYEWFINNAVCLDPGDDPKPVYLNNNGTWERKTAFERVNGEWVYISGA